MTDTNGVVPTAGRPDLLRIYLNDHLAGSAGGVALARRLAGAHADTAAGQELSQLAREVTADRDSLLDIMRTLDVPRMRFKEPLAVVVERLGRLKPNGALLGRSPLSSVIELETMALGVTGKLAGWRTLQELSGSEPRLDPAQLDRLISRAEEQLSALERLRVAAVSEALAR